MILTEHVNRFMELYWRKDWNGLRALVSDSFHWENIAVEGVHMSFDEMVEQTVAFHDGGAAGEFIAEGGTWPPLEEGRAVIRSSVEHAEMVAHQRMDLWKAGGLWYQLPCAGFWQFENGQIRSWTDYWDLDRMNHYRAGTLKGEPVAWDERGP